MTGDRQDGGVPRRGEARLEAARGSRRADRVAGEIQKALSELLVRRIKDPRLEQVTVTAVRLTPDLRHARVFFTLLDDRADRQEAERALAHALPFLRRSVAAAVALRYAPELEFVWDAALEGARHIDALLRGLQARVEGTVSAAGEPGKGVSASDDQAGEPATQEDAGRPGREPPDRDRG